MNNEKLKLQTATAAHVEFYILHFALALSGYLLSLAVHTPIARPITPEQAVQEYERRMEQELFSTPSLPQPQTPRPDRLKPTPAIHTRYIHPTTGTLTSGYGWRWGRMHKGIDIAGAIGTPIVASADGQVIFAGWNSGGYGYLVEILHSDGSVTRYAHNSNVLVKTGDLIQQGQAIALMGSTGYSTGPHCHFEIIMPNGRSVDPLAFLPPR